MIDSARLTEENNAISAAIDQAKTCPSCGYCPACGQRGWGVYPSYPIYPIYPTYPAYPQNPWWIPTITSSTGG